MLIESQNVLGTCGGRRMAQPHNKNKASFEVRSYFKVKSGCSGHQSCQEPLRIRHQTDKSVVVQIFSTQPGRVSSGTHTSDRHPERELLRCQRHWHALSLLPARAARAQGPRASCIWSHKRSAADGEQYQALQSRLCGVETSQLKCTV